MKTVLWSTEDLTLTSQNTCERDCETAQATVNEGRNQHESTLESESRPALCDPMDYTVHGILQARILEQVAFPFSRGSSQPTDIV